MHIPDGFLSTAVSLGLWFVSIVIIAMALQRVGRDLGERQVPLMGVLAAAIFAGQMLNFAIAGGTSGHLLGAALATMLLGPWPAVVVMTSVVSIQALVFQDGGILALGANLLNMAVIGVAVSQFAFSSIRRFISATRPAVLVAAGFSAWLSIVAASIACALELAASGTIPASLAIPAMAGVHALIGIGEVLITVGAAAFILAARPDILDSTAGRQSSGASVWIAGAVLTLALGVAAPLAATSPDGLQWVADRQGFLGLARSPLYGLMPGYAFPGIPDKATASIVAAILGSILVLGTTLLVMRVRKPKPPS